MQYGWIDFEEVITVCGGTVSRQLAIIYIVRVRSHLEHFGNGIRLAFRQG